MIQKISKDIKLFWGNNLVSIVLFGSYASAKQTSTSDIDILVIADNLPSSKKDRLSLILSITRKYLSLGKSVSIVLHSREEILNGFEFYNPLLLSISENYKLLYDDMNFFINLMRAINNKIAKKKIRKFGDYSWRIAV